jgi:hypothetical protein
MSRHEQGRGGIRQIRRTFSCDKWRYSSKSKAERALVLARSRGAMQYAEVLRVYECADCGGHHLTSSPVRGTG